MSAQYPSWAPLELVEIIKKKEGKSGVIRSIQFLDLYKRLVSDQRMREVWEWHAVSVSGCGIYGSPFSFANVVAEAARIPGKPGNMTPKRREAYFTRVRRLVRELQTELTDTSYDCADQPRFDVTHEDAKEELGEHVANEARARDMGRIAVNASYFDDTGNWRSLPLDYPYSHLVEILNDVIAWTEEESRWERSALISSKPIRHGGERGCVFQFNCTVYEQLHWWKIEIPFRILATLASVVLEQEVTEGTAQKHVTRYFSRAD